MHDEAETASGTPGNAYDEPKVKYPYVKVLASAETIKDHPDNVASAAVRGMFNKKVADDEIKEFVSEWYRAKEKDIISVVRKWVSVGTSMSPRCVDGGVIIQ